MAHPVKRKKSVVPRRKTKAARRAPRAAVRRKSKALLYSYGFVRDGFDPARAPRGLDDAPVVVVPGPGVGALVSLLPTDQYSAAEVERRTADVSWLSPRAMAHDRVLTWAQEHGGVLPMPMFTLWGSKAALTRVLTKRARELTRVFGRVGGADEFGVRVYRRDDVMLERLDDLDAETARLRREALAASPGQRYLLERKIADQGKQAAKAASHRLARQVFEELRVLAREAVARPLVPESGRAPEATLVLNGAFLVDRTRLDEFRAAVGDRVRAYQPRGLTFDFTGPWPPYHFAGPARSTRSARAK